MTPIVVFTGPTIPPSHAREILDADYRAPAKAGDVLAVAPSRPAAIVLIDGFFETVPSVWHKEILFALSEGIRVYGSSSMGALRAAELHAFGMIGVGRVFEGYRSGLLEDDDEVAVIHGPEAEDWMAQSEAMVNIREGLRLANERGLINAAMEDRLIAAAKALHYADRSWPAILRVVAMNLPPDALSRFKAFLQTADTNVKRQDAIELLRRVADDASRNLPPFRPTFRLERTSFFEALKQAVRAHSAHS